MNQNIYSIPSREEILGILRNLDEPQTPLSLAQLLSVKDSDIQGLFKRLNAMERDGQIKPDRKGRFKLANFTNFVEGIISSHRDGFGFLIVDEGNDIFLSEREMQKVMHGDRVQVRVSGLDRKGRTEGSIVEVISRANTHVIGSLINENGTWIVVPEDKRIGHDIILFDIPSNIKEKYIVSVELIEHPTRHTQPVGKIVEVLGEIDDPGMEIEIAVRKYGVPHEFSSEIKKNAMKLPEKVQNLDFKNRIDLRDVPLITIDGEDSRDFDDAIYCEKVKLDQKIGFRLIVSIADVSHYVKSDDAIDNEALVRSTSVYFPRKVIPMLPEKLSNDICSLKPNLDRLTLTCDMVINENGVIEAYQFYPSVINSKARLTYNELSTILNNTKGLEAEKRISLLPHLQNLYEIFSILNHARNMRGAIDFETTETYIVCNDVGKIEQILPKNRTEAHKIIEECMLAANVCAASFIDLNNHIGMYRIHEGPDVDKLTQLKIFLKQMGLNLSGGDKPTAIDYANLVKKIKNRPDSNLLQTMLLRSMQQAIYSPENIGHFGLSYDAYVHFTSPIRRYPDLITHRIIKAILGGKKYTPKNSAKIKLNEGILLKSKKVNSKVQHKNKGKFKGINSFWEQLGIHCSANERRADEATRDVEAWLKCYFIRDKLGEEFTGTISGVTAFGIFVQLDLLYIEGMVHVADLGADYFNFDDIRHELRGERTGMRFQLTDKVKVQVSRVDLDARKIDLSLVKELSFRDNFKNNIKKTEAILINSNNGKKKIKRTLKSNLMKKIKKNNKINNEKN